MCENLLNLTHFQEGTKADPRWKEEDLSIAQLISRRGQTKSKGKGGGWGNL